MNNVIYPYEISYLTYYYKNIIRQIKKFVYKIKFWI
jgi:hypothetical protein